MKREFVFVIIRGVLIGAVLGVCGILFPSWQFFLCATVFTLLIYIQ